MTRIDFENIPIADNYSDDPDNYCTELDAKEIERYMQKIEKEKRLRKAKKKKWKNKQTYLNS